MNDSSSRYARTVIPHELVIAVLDRYDERREFMIQMWLQNPQLARQGGARVAALLAPLQSSTAPTE